MPPPNNLHNSTTKALNVYIPAYRLLCLASSPNLYQKLDLSIVVSDLFNFEMSSFFSVTRKLREIGKLKSI